MKTLIDKIGHSRLVLSPMAGYSDSPYRKICRRMGSAFSITEFVSTLQLFCSSARAISLFRYEECERPIVFQIFGNDPEIIIRGVSRVLHLNPDGIDLNMGCSVKTVAGSGSGAGLLRCPDKARTIIRRLIAETGLPISAKIRLGWDHSSLNYMEISEMLESEGVWAIAVHGRTRQMGYSGKADWERIAEIARARKIPVFGNGDITSTAQAYHYIEKYGVAGVYIGRGAMGNPWIFAGIDKAQLGFAQRLPVILEHLDSMAQFYGDTLAAVLMRKHLTHYLRDLPVFGSLKAEIYTQQSAQALREVLLRALDKSEKSCDDADMPRHALSESPAWV
ncbi:MAG: tRNA-dihydrouridine synthase family protein [Turneriella sp.]|nr:tRNA-dihydrouridine synthase family protein [Turneriella sp.]